MDYIHKRRRIKQEEAVDILKQILNGFKVSYLVIQGLHEVGAMHRNFKSANVLINKGCIKIADLGVCKQMPSDGYSKTKVGTFTTMGLEVL